LKDSQQHADYYKSGAIHTRQGEPPNSNSKPTPKGKPVPPKPITRGKLIKPGGPGGRPSRLTGNHAAKPRAAASDRRSVPQPPAALSAASHSAASASKPSPAATPAAHHTRNQGSTSSVNRGPAPPPPPPPASAPAQPPRIMAKVLHDFAGDGENQLSISAGQIIEIVRKENNGKSSSDYPSAYPWPLTSQC